MPGLVNRRQGIRESIISVFLYGSEYWFLYTLFLIFVLAPLVVKFYEENKILTCVIVLAIGLISNFFTNIFSLNSIAFYLPCFMLGVIGKKYKIIDLINEKLKNHSLKFKFVLGVIVFVLILFNGYIHYISKIRFADLIEGLIGTILITIFILLLNRLFRIFEKYSRYSLPLYLLNGYLLVISRTVVIKIFGFTNPMFIIVCNMLIDFCFSYIAIHYCFSRIPLVRDVIGIPVKKKD